MAERKSYNRKVPWCGCRRWRSSVEEERETPKWAGIPGTLACSFPSISRLQFEP